MSSSTKQIGQIGEDVAAEFLQRKGYEILDRNYRQPWGEIDIIGVKDGVVRFIEVKSVSRESLSDHGLEEGSHRPEEMVHEHKIRKISMTAEMYMNGSRDTRDYQIDVVGVFLDVKNRRAKCRLLEGVI